MEKQIIGMMPMPEGNAAPFSTDLSVTFKEVRALTQEDILKLG